MFFLIDSDGRKSGPFQISQLAEMVKSGQIAGESLIENAATQERAALCMNEDYIAALQAKNPTASSGPYRSPVPYSRAMPGEMSPSALNKGLNSRSGTEPSSWKVWAAITSAGLAVASAFFVPYIHLLFSIASIALAYQAKVDRYRKSELLLMAAAASVPIGLATVIIRAAL